ncbi:MAG: hypothetical protein E6K10_01630 [Methanobacteriota archaeon]|nr:MAG: hypothetical protein E6K10_01630 [Euryarchaeota archaeon]
MELEIVARRDNPLLKRTEVQFRVSHPKEPSPQRAALRDQLALALHATRDIVVVDFTKSEFGRATSRGYAKVYKSKEDALRTERKHILVRNGLMEAVKKEVKVKEPKPPPPKREAPKPAEKPAAPPKEEKPAAKEEKKAEGKPPAEKKEAKPAAEKKEEKKPEGKKGGKEGK